jgi:hypothetical protein
MLDAGDNKIGRPRQLYTGQPKRDFKAVEVREHSTGRVNWSWLWGKNRGNGNGPVG